VREEDFDRTLNINLKGTFFACQAAGKVMKEQGGGRIINMSSQAGFVALPTESVYCMTKAGIAHLTKCLAVEWGPYNINVNAVAPTFIHTPGTQPAPSSPEFLRRDSEKRRCPPSHRGTTGGSRGSRLPGVASRRADHRTYFANRWRLDGCLGHHSIRSWSVFYEP
jgi:NAD(P)-dependent dehydrogenase (short-subunit alcohol dehydrogenase family)